MHLKSLCTRVWHEHPPQERVNLINSLTSNTSADDQSQCLSIYALLSPNAWMVLRLAHSSITEFAIKRSSKRRKQGAQRHNGALVAPVQQGKKAHWCLCPHVGEKVPTQGNKAYWCTKEKNTHSFPNLIQASLTTSFRLVGLKWPNCSSITI